MKRYIHKLLLASLVIASALTSVSCDDYLSVVPKGEKIPTTLADFEALLRSEYDCQRSDYLQALILLNDCYQNSGNLNYYPLYAANYNWDESVDRTILNKDDETAFYAGYAAINTFNLLIENAASTTEATDAQKKELEAQARVLRAMNYFNLVNYYADTYVSSTAASKGGVPLITSAAVNASYTQPSVQEIYDFMLADMAEAYNYLPEMATTILHPDKATADAFYARLYLQMGNFDKALEHADKALSFNGELYDWVKFYEEHREVIENPEYISYSIPSPMGHDYVENYNFRHGTSSNATSERSIPLIRMNQTETGDTRMAARWKPYTAAGDTYYRSSMNGYYNYGGMTTVEVYLIKSECLARSGRINEAMDVLNAVRVTRILSDCYQPLTATTEAEAMAYIMRTKNNEMLLTQIPFNDARRLNAEGKYPVTLSKEVDGVTLALSPTSHLWTMPFPQGAIKNHGNGSITQNVNK